MPLRFMSDGPYSLGMDRDHPSLAIPPGAVYDSNNMLSDQPAVLRQRNASTALVSGAQTAFATMIGFVYSQDGLSSIEELYGVNGKTGAVLSINKTTGASTSLSTPLSAGVIGRPARYFGFTIFPETLASSTAPRASVIVCGQTSSTTFTSATAATITAGSNTVTLGGADTTTNVKVGAFCSLIGTYVYFGRVVSITDATHFKVWPTPVTSDTSLATTTICQPARADAGGACVTAFQNRLLYGNTYEVVGSGSSVNDRRVTYSPLPTERSPVYTTNGVTFVLSQQNNPLNYFDIPGGDPIVAIEPISNGELLILTSTHPVLLRGNLVTELSTTSPSITYDLDEINEPYGCLSDLSVQRTSRGVAWASSGGVYAYNGSTIKNLAGDHSDKRIASYWRSLSSAGAALVIHGSAFVRNHYIISGTSGGTLFSLACNLDNLQWTRLSGVGTDIFYGLSQPSTANATVFVSRWWNQSSTAPSMTNGQTLRVETMFDPDIAGQTKLDADGNRVAITLVTKPIGGDLETQKMLQRMTIRYQAEMDSASIIPTVQTRIDAANVNGGSLRQLAPLSSTAMRSVSGATNASPIELTTSAAHGLQTDDFVNVDAVTGTTSAIGRWRIVKTSATKFTLNASTGNGAYAGGGTVEKLTEADFLISSLNKGQAVTVSLQDTGAVNRFEFQGVTIAALVAEPVMST